MRSGKLLERVICFVTAAAVAFGIAVGAVGLSGDASSGDRIPVAYEGQTVGYVEHDDLYGADATKPFVIEVYDSDGSGRVVGSYGNISGFVPKDVGDAPGFDQLTFADERGSRACIIIDDGPPRCLVGG